MTETVTAPVEVARPGVIGENVERVEDERLVRGLGKFVDDVDPPRLTHMAVVRCPYPRARIVSIDASRARELEGVLQVLLPEDVLDRTGPITVLRPIPDSPRIMLRALAGDVARYEGEPVASVCAVSRYVAEDAAGLVEVEWEPLDSVTDVEAALADGAPILHDELETNLLVRNPRGDGDPAVEAAFFAVADAFEVYEDALYEAYNEVTPLQVFEDEEDEDEDGEIDDDDEDLEILKD